MKQSFTPGGQCSYPDGYVVPRPEFFARLETLARRAAGLIAALPVPPLRTVLIPTRRPWGEGEPAAITLSAVKDAQIDFLNTFAGYVGRLLGLAEKELRGERLNGNEKMLYAGPVLSHYQFELVGSPKRLSDTDWIERWRKAGFDERTPLSPEIGQERDWSEIPPHPEWTRSYLVPHPTRP